MARVKVPVPAWRIIVAPILAFVMLVLSAAALGMMTDGARMRNLHGLMPYLFLLALGILIALSSWVGGLVAPRWIVPITLMLVLIGITLYTQFKAPPEFRWQPMALVGMTIYLVAPVMGFLPALRRAQRREEHRRAREEELELELGEAEEPGLREL